MAVHRLRLRNHPDAATPLDSAEGEEGEHPSTATWRSEAGSEKVVSTSMDVTTVLCMRKNRVSTKGTQCKVQKSGVKWCKVPVLRA